MKLELGDDTTIDKVTSSPILIELSSKLEDKKQILKMESRTVALWIMCMYMVDIQYNTIIIY